MTEEKLDIFDVLTNINKKNYHFYSNLDDRMKAMFSPYVVYNWMTSSPDPLQIILMDRIIGEKVFTLSDHKELLYKLFCVTVNKPVRYEWIYKKNADNEKISIIAEYLNCSKRVAKLYNDFYDKNDITEMLQDMGYQDDEIKKRLKSI